MNRKILTSLLALFSASVLLVGCAATGASPSVSEDIVTVPETPAEAPESVDEEDGPIDFPEPAEGDITLNSEVATARDVAYNSCDRAQMEGVVEYTPEIAMTAVLVPKEEGIEGYSAASQMGEDYSLIYALDSFVVCILALEFAFSEEAGEDPMSWIASTEVSDESISVEIIYPDAYSYTYTANLDDEGFIVSATTLNSDGVDTFGVTIVSYGYTEEDKAVIQEAYDREIASFVE